MWKHKIIFNLKIYIKNIFLSFRTILNFKYGKIAECQKIDVYKYYENVYYSFHLYFGHFL
jgi:hypothetical protein